MPLKFEVQNTNFYSSLFLEATEPGAYKRGWHQDDQAHKRNLLQRGHERAQIAAKYRTGGTVYCV
jgi:hypothetical protein